MFKFELEIGYGLLTEEEKEIIEATKDIIITIIDKRNELNLTQRDLAKISGINQSAIARLEKFKVVPKIDTIYKLSKCLGLKMTLIEENNKPIIYGGEQI
jgi:predicted transcriptional regulator